MILSRLVTAAAWDIAIVAMLAHHAVDAGAHEESSLPAA